MLLSCLLGRRSSFFCVHWANKLWPFVIRAVVAFLCSRTPPNEESGGRNETQIARRHSEPTSWNKCSHKNGSAEMWGSNSPRIIMTRNGPRNIGQRTEHYGSNEPIRRVCACVMACAPRPIWTQRWTWPSVKDAMMHRSIFTEIRHFRAWFMAHLAHTTHIATRRHSSEVGRMCA